MLLADAPEPGHSQAVIVVRQEPVPKDMTMLVLAMNQRETEPV
jgi:hypothetical protein